MPIVTLISAVPSKSPRLEANELPHVFMYLFELHDHSARTPAAGMYWHRESIDEQNPVGRN